MMKHVLNEPPCKIMTGSQIPKSINFVFNYIKKYFLNILRQMSFYIRISFKKFIFHIIFKAIEH